MYSKVRVHIRVQANYSNLKDKVLQLGCLRKHCFDNSLVIFDNNFLKC